MSPPDIVVIDDDFDKRFLLIRFLEREFPGHAVLEFESCLSAEPAVFSPRSKIVITNGRVAGKDGIEFAARITQQTSTPVVVISLRPELKEKALAAGVMSFVETGNDSEIHDAVAHALQVVESA